MSPTHRSDSIKIFLVADHSLLGQSLAGFLDQHFTCIVADENRPLAEQIDQIKPNHTIFALDLKPKKLKVLGDLLGSGYQNTSVFSAELPLAVQEKLFLAGVKGILDSSMRPEVLVRAIRKLCDGEVWISRRITARLLANMPKSGQNLTASEDAIVIKRLTPRQLKIAKCCAQNLGASNKVLATKLQLGESSLRNALSGLFRTLELRNRNEFFLFLQKNPEMFL